MPLDVAVNTFSVNALMPALDPQSAKRILANFPPLTTVPKGQILLQAAATVNDVQTITIGGTPTGGTFTLSGVHPLTGALFTTAAIAFNAAAAAVQTALLAVLGTGNVTVTGGALPGAAVVVTLGGQLAGMPMAAMTGNIAGLTGGAPTFGNVHTTTGSTKGTWSPYSGSGTARAINMYPLITDAGGRITYGGATATGGYFGESELSAPIYIAGTFYTTDLIGLDAAAIAAMSGANPSNNLYRFG